MSEFLLPRKHPGAFISLQQHCERPLRSQEPNGLASKHEGKQGRLDGPVARLSGSSGRQSCVLPTRSSRPHKGLRCTSPHLSDDRRGTPSRMLLNFCSLWFFGDRVLLYNSGGLEFIISPRLALNSRAILLPQLRECWDERCVLPRLASP